MRLSSVLQLAVDYMVPGMIGAVVLVILVLTGYYIVYKKLMNGTKELSTARLALVCIFFIYCVVVLGATLISRGSYGLTGFNLQLFDSYRSAWINSSPEEWRNLIWNILMFVPLGLLLPVLFQNCRKCWVTYLAGVFASVVVELIQLVTGSGVFDLDDIFNNILGAAIGYGIAALFFKPHTTKRVWLKRLGCQIPLILTLIGFGTAWAVYSNQEFGNLSLADDQNVDMSDVKINSIGFAQESGKAYVYKTEKYTKEDTRKKAEELFEADGAVIDDSYQDVYDRTIVYQSQGNEPSYHAWVDYLGLSVSYTAFLPTEEPGKEGMKYEEVRSILGKYKIELPDEAQFTEEGEGNYTIVAEMAEYAGGYLDGMLSCTIDVNDAVKSFSNRILQCEKYKEVDIISEQEAFEAIEAGKFISPNLEELTELNITGVRLTYEIDSKGYHQPVYEFKAGDESIRIPAMKK